MTLTAAYTRFLKRRRGREELVAALQRADRGLEAELLTAWTHGTVATDTGDGRRAWVGPSLPDGARPGDLWLDVVEAMPMVLVSRGGEPFGWLGLRPVERWQFAGFLAVAETQGAQAQYGDFRSLDASRLLAEAEAEPVLTARGEASLYAQWFGKLVADRIDWQIASETLDPASLWGGVPREWSGEEWEGVHGVTDRETLHLEGDLPDELLFRDWEAPGDVGFRTFVRCDTGLFTDTTEVIGVRLRDRARR